ncbi:MAG: hypothetical protein C5B49_12460 [Bdellovibrio sp.]|nr:MAG: hypothetical protein C5B49_12460 [Bdellovibrio sp.]
MEGIEIRRLMTDQDANGDVDVDVDLAALSALFESVGMRKRSPSAMRAALAGSSDVVVAYQAETLVGIGRLVSDRVYYGGIWDVAVRPDLQSKGIGSRILNELLVCAKARGLIMIGLFTAHHNRNFYEQFGFQFRPDIHAMTLTADNARGGFAAHLKENSDE